MIPVAVDKPEPTHRARRFGGDAGRSFLLTFFAVALVAAFLITLGISLLLFWSARRWVYYVGER